MYVVFINGVKINKNFKINYFLFFLTFKKTFFSKLKNKFFNKFIYID
jgi:hypothetical protein